MSFSTFWLNDSLTTANAMKSAQAQLFHRAHIEQAQQLANVFEDFDLAHNACVATLLANSPMTQALLFAIPSYGAQLQILNPNFSLEFLIREFNNYQARLLVVDSQYLDLIKSIRSALVHIEHIIVIGDMEAADAMIYYSLSTLVADVSSEYIWPDLDEDALAIISYEHNYQGQIQAVTYSHRQLFLTALNVSSQDALQLSKNDKIYWDLPLYQEMAWVIPVASMLLGASLTVIENDEYLEQTREMNFTCFFVEQNKYSFLLSYLREGKEEHRSLRLFVSPYSTSEQLILDQHRALQIVQEGINICIDWSALISQDPMTQTKALHSSDLVKSHYIFPQHPSIM